ncbi:MAG TPA: AMP-binding protein [Casimicrobiaceae bacterium]
MVVTDHDPVGPGNALRFPVPPAHAAERLAAWWPGVWQLWWGRTAGTDVLRDAARLRLDALVAHARRHSPLMRELYRSLPATPALDELPVTRKRDLMGRFDDWVTDTAVRRTDIDAFLADPSRVGQRYLERYVVWQSSGTTGECGIFVQGDLALEVYDALIAVQMSAGHLASHCFAGLVKGGRAALVAATAEHFASIASWQRACRTMPGLAARSFSIAAPLPDLVAQLNAFGPAYLATYPAMLRLLADERRAGRLRIYPSLVWAGGESLPASVRSALERAWGCPVVNEYGASECMSIAFGCTDDWLHVNADWVLVEAVDADYRPARPGEPSHTVLITNLANRVQPVIRYDLGDSVTVNPERCRCGNPLPAIRVEGRRDDVLEVPLADGRAVALASLALVDVIEDAIHMHRFQLVQTAADRLLLRLCGDDERMRAATFAAARDALARYLAAHGASAVTIELDSRAPQADAPSGKLRQVLREPQDGARARRLPGAPARRPSRYVQ